MTLVALPIALPLLGAGLALAVGPRQALRRSIGLATSASVVVVALLLLDTVRSSGPQVLQVGGWGPEIGIVLVADLLAVLILVVAALVVLAAHLHAVLTPSLEDDWAAFHTVMSVLGAGVALSLLTGDLFTLFVGFEVSLVASYVLLLGKPGRSHLPATRTYVIANVVVSTVFLIGVAAVYAAAGTINMAELASVWPSLDPLARLALGGVLLVVFATKAAAFPFFGWLPEAYRTASVPVAAVLAGLLTKLGVYALVRTHTLLGLVPDTVGWLLPTIAGLTMAVGVVGALAQTDVRRVLSFHIVSQIGYMLFGLALVGSAGAAGAGLAATVFYVVHHILVKSALFLVAGVIEEQGGTGSLDRLGGLVRTAPWLAALFAVPALSLAGIPPFSGFTAKLALFDAGITGEAWALVATAAIVSLLTIMSMAKLWAGAFWGQTPPALAVPISAAGVGRRSGGAALLVVGTLIVSFSAAPLLELSGTAATQLLDPSTYIGMVRS